MRSVGKVAWNKGKRLHYTIWNKGLTKETDKRVMKISKNLSKDREKNSCKFCNKITENPIFCSRKCNGKYQGNITRGKTQKDLYGIEKAKSLKIQHSNFMKDWCKNNENYRKGKKLYEIFGKEKAKEIINKSCSFKGKGNKSIPEKKLFNLVKNIFPEALNNSLIKIGYRYKRPDILIKELKLIIEYDGIKWHKLSNDKDRDKEIIFLGYKIIHYQGYLPSDIELREDINNIISSRNNYFYKRFGINITNKIKIRNSYEKLEVKQ